MSVINASDLADDDPVGVPLIGYDNIVTTSNITSTTEDTDFPVSNLANNATHLKWVGGATSGDEYITITSTLAHEINYLAVAKHNFGSDGIVASIEGLDPAHVLLHFDRDGSSPDVITDSNSLGSAHTWTAFGNANEATTQFKFGGSSLACDGTGDYVSTPDHADFEFAALDFTIDFWIRPTVTASVGICRHGTGVDNWLIRLASDSSVSFELTVDSTLVVTCRDPAASVVANTWAHVAITRSENVFRLFINGVLKDTDTLSVAIPDITGALEVGRTGAAGFNGFIDEWRLLVGVAEWTENFTVAKRPYGWSDLFSSSNTSLLHFEGVDASTTITDSVGAHTWSCVANAQIDTSQAKFGDAAALFDGSGDYIQGDGSADFAFGAGDFTIDFWVRIATGLAPVLYDARPTGVGSGDYPVISIDSANDCLEFRTDVFTQKIVGTTALQINRWYHVALTRSGTSTRLFLDGVQQGSTYTDTHTYLNGTNRPTLGANGDGPGGSAHHGWIDELRILKGTAVWTADFTPATSAYGAHLIDDDSPIIFRFAMRSLAGVRLKLEPSGVAPEAAVIYVGELLVMERSIKVDVDHVPITYGRRTSVVNGMSETGNFLGRIVLGEYRESKAEFAWFTPTFYRSDIDPFVDVARSHPFFWAWYPTEYPAETGYVWLTKDAEPEVHTVTQRIALTLEMRGIA